MSKTIDKYTYHPSHDLIATGSSGKVTQYIMRRSIREPTRNSISKLF